MTAIKPAPLVPAEVDLRDFPFMPLDVRRLRDSRLIATRAPEEVVAAVLLWAASWHQQPASSLPDDDLELSQLAGYGRAVKEFRRIREGALHGLIACADGRLYHPVVAEKAAEAWNSRLESEWRRACDRVRKDNKDRKERGEPEAGLPPKPSLLSMKHVDGIPSWDYTDSAGIPSARLRNSSLKGEGKGQGYGQGIRTGMSPVPPEPPPVKRSGRASRRPAAEKDEGRTNLCWQAYSEAYAQRYAVDPVRNAKVSGMLAKFLERVPADEAPEIAAFYVRSNRGLYLSSKHCIDLLLRDAEGIRTEWATGRTVTDTEARRADRTQATGNAFAGLIAEAEEREAHAK